MKYLLQTAIALVLLYSQAVFALPDGSINVNTASPDVLAEVLDGVGSARAQAIVEYREQYGDFVDLEDLLDVRGIGPQVIEANRDKIAFTD